MGSARTVLEYFRERAEAAGYVAKLGYSIPDLARAPQNKLACDFWLTDGEYQFQENYEYPWEVRDTVEVYLYRVANPSTDNGKWYDDIDEFVKILTHNHEDRPKAAGLWWDGQTVRVDRVAPLKRWDNSQDYSEGYFCCRIELPVKYLPAQL